MESTAPDFLKLIPVESHGHQETREWNENRFHQPDPKVHLRGEKPTPTTPVWLRTDH